MAMKTRIIYGTSLDPYLNLAYEEDLLDNLGEEAILFLWQNHDTVVIGRNQNPWRECNVAKMEQDGVKLARRATGGGAVFHDMGNLNFSFIVPKHVYSVARQGQVIIKALAELGLVAEQTGRNDITIDGRKFSGNAFMHRKVASLHHGTILIGSDMSRLVGYLNVPADKLTGKGVASVRSRVVNLAELVPGLDLERVKQCVSDSFIREYGRPDSIETTDLTDTTENTKKLAERNSSWDWRFGKTPEFSITLQTRFSWGGVELGLLNRHAIVEEATLWSDGMMPEMGTLVSAALRNSPFVAQEMAKRILSIQSDWEEERAVLADVAAWLAENPL